MRHVQEIISLLWLEYVSWFGAGERGVEYTSPPCPRRGGEREGDDNNQWGMKLETGGIRCLTSIALQIQGAWGPAGSPSHPAIPNTPSPIRRRFRSEELPAANALMLRPGRKRVRI